MSLSRIQHTKTTFHTTHARVCGKAARDHGSLELSRAGLPSHRGGNAYAARLPTLLLHLLLAALALSLLLPAF